MRMLLIVSIILLGTSLSYLSTLQAANQGRIITDGANIYRDPDFDSPIVTHLKAGTVLDISSRLFGPFFKVRYKDKSYGYISDVDIKSFKKPVNAGEGDNRKDGPDSSTNTSPSPWDEGEGTKRRRSFAWTSYRGIQLSYLNYVENSMGRKWVSNLPMMGFKIVGPDLLLEGASVAEINFLVGGVPEYYKQATRKETSGWTSLLDIMAETSWPLGKSVLFYAGLGPLIKFSHYDVRLNNQGYSLDDFNLGLAGSGGFALRLWSFSLRFEGTYYYETTQYVAGSATLLYNW